jgi:hypothetical protein
MAQYFTMPPLQWNNCLKVYLHKVKIERDVNYNRGLTGCIKNPPGMNYSACELLGFQIGPIRGEPNQRRCLPSLQYIGIGE